MKKFLAVTISKAVTGAIASLIAGWAYEEGRKVGKTSDILSKWVLNWEKKHGPDQTPVKITLPADADLSELLKILQQVAPKTRPTRPNPEKR